MKAGECDVCCKKGRIEEVFYKIKIEFKVVLTPCFA